MDDYGIFLTAIFLVTIVFCGFFVGIIHHVTHKHSSKKSKDDTSSVNDSHDSVWH